MEALEGLPDVTTGLEENDEHNGQDNKAKHEEFLSKGLFNKGSFGSHLPGALM